MYMKKSISLLCATLLLTSFSVSKLYAWGPEGHKIVALIATDSLTPRAKASINRILRTDAALSGATLPERMMHAATWPDDIKSHSETPVSAFLDMGIKNAEGTHALHYADFEGTGSQAKPHCPDNHCVITAINKCKTILGDKNAEREEQIEALKFLVHFVGDIHQPLHAGAVEDKGGNNI